VEEIVGQQASLLSRFYHNVKVFAGDGGKFSDSYEIEINPLLGSKHEQVVHAHRLSAVGDSKSLQALAGKLYDYLREALQGFDLLIAHNVLTMPYNLPLSAALHRIGREGRLPIISWNHDSPYFYPGYPEHLDRFPWNMLKRAYAGIHYVAVSKSRKQMFTRLYGSGKRIHVIPNGIDPIGFFRLDPGTVRLIQEQRLFEAEFIMVQPSRLHPRKNIELSIRVTRALHDSGLRSRMLITGARDHHNPETISYLGKLKDLSLELGIEDDVLIVADYAFKSGEKLPADRIIIRDLYLIADILFLPSFQEGFGIPLLESGMIKLPIVCSNIPPFLEIGGEDVFTFDCRDRPEDIAAGILDFVGGLKPHKMFRKVIRSYVWDTIYHAELLPLLSRVTGG
jgi:glycosyltransferase involved in cell wall biosynthesis